MRIAEHASLNARARRASSTAASRFRSRSACELGLDSLQDLALLRSAADATNGFGRVLVAVDELSRASGALAVAARAADPSVGRVRLVHVRPWRLAPPPTHDDGIVLPSMLGELFVETSQRAAELTDAAVRDVQLRGLMVDGVVVEAQQTMLGAAIASAARGWNAELIVIGRHERGALGWMLRHRTSDQVMREASCPVLVVRSASR